MKFGLWHWYSDSDGFLSKSAGELLNIHVLLDQFTFNEQESLGIRLWNMTIFKSSPSYCYVQLLGSLTFMDLWIHNFYQIWKILENYFFKYIIISLLIPPFSFWTLNICKTFNIFPQVTEVCFLIFSLSGIFFYSCYCYVLNYIDFLPPPKASNLT